jgi:putative phosphoribosyl transferase
METEVEISARGAMLDGNLTVATGARGIVLFVHGSGSSRHSKRNRFVARTLNEAGLATLLFDLLTREEEAVDMRTAHLRFDIGLLAERLGAATGYPVMEMDEGFEVWKNKDLEIETEVPGSKMGSMKSKSIISSSQQA